MFLLPKLSGSSETLLRIINGSSSFCKCPRTSKVWKSKNPKGPRTLRLCLSEDLCKNNYSYLHFAAVTFLTKIQNWCCTSKKTCQKTTVKKIWMVKATTVQKIWMGKTTTIQEFWLQYKKWKVVKFPSHFFINTILNFGQECIFLVHIFFEN